MRGQPKSFDWRVMLKRKIIFLKKKSKEWGSNWKRYTINFDWVMKLKTNKTLIKKAKEKKLGIKRIRIELEKVIYVKL